MAQKRKYGHPTRRRILEVVKKYQQEHGFSPTLRDIGKKAMIASISSVEYHLCIMETDGIITRRPRTARSIVVIGEYENE